MNSITTARSGNLAAGRSDLELGARRSGGGGLARSAAGGVPLFDDPQPGQPGRCGHPSAGRAARPSGPRRRPHPPDLQGDAQANPDWTATVRVDIQAYYDRDPACDRFLMPVLYFKGFHAIQTHRLAHWLWNQGRKDFALYLQSRSSSVFQTDINPGRPDGQGHLHRPCHRPGRRRNRGDRGRRVDPAWRDAGRHRQGRRRPSSRRSATAC